MFAPAVCGAAAKENQDPESAGAKKNEFWRFFPPEIKTVAVISPASMPNKKTIEAAISEMRKHGIKVKPGKWIFDKEHKKGASGASLTRRKEDFLAAWLDPEVDLIMCTRGGSGAQHLIQQLDWELLKKNPKKLIGFSNITMVTSAMLKKKAGHPYAGPNLGRLYGIEKNAGESFRRGLSNEKQEKFQLKAIKPGDCKGGIYAGHLAMLEMVEKLPEFRFDPAGRIVFIESSSRTSEQWESYWNTLLKGGFFKDVRGVVFGHFTGAKLRPGETLDQLLKKFADTLSCPVYQGFPYGHKPDICTLDFFAQAEIKSGVLTITPEKH